MNRGNRGKIILVSGPSGSGKGALIDYARTLYPDMMLSISCTTRAMRPGEVDGQHYHFLSVEEFKRRIDAGEFLEWAQYGGNYYGTPAAPVLAEVAAGRVALLEIEAQGARQVRANTASDMLRTVFIDAGSWEDLEKRIRARAPITDAELEKRHARFEDENRYKGEANFVINNANGQFEQAKNDFADLILSIRNGAR